MGGEQVQKRVIVELGGGPEARIRRRPIEEKERETRKQNKGGVLKEIWK